MKPLAQRSSHGAGRKGAIFGLVCGALATLIFQAPASWLAHAVEHWSRGQFQLQQASGTVWNGSAQWVVSAHAGASSQALALPGKVHWQLRPAWLGLHVSLSADCCTPAGPVALDFLRGPQGPEIRIRSKQSIWPAGLSAAWGAPWNTLALQGRLRLDSDGLRLQQRAGRWQAAGQAQIDALDLSSPISTLQPLGSYRLNLGQGSEGKVQLQTLQGDLQLQGEGQWSDATLRFRGTASAAPGREEALNALLNIIGQRQGSQSIITLG